MARFERRGFRPPMMGPRLFGILGEAVVLLSYALRGYRVVARRWRVHQRGEIDLIVRRFRTIVFVEVKSRRSDSFGVIHEGQVHRIRAAAQRFLYKFPQYGQYDVRLELACVNRFFWPAVVSIDG